MSEGNTNELIQQFLRGDLNNDETLAFQERLKKEPGMETLMAEELVRMKARLDLKKALVEVREELEEEQPATRVGVKKNWWAAAAAIVLLIVSSAVWVLSQEATAPKLAQTYFEPFPSTSLTRASGEENTTQFDMAFALYSKTEYKDALLALDQITSETEADLATVAFFRGQCLLSIQPPAAEEAVKSFEYVLQKKSDLASWAQWYLTLSLLASNQTERAKAELEKLNHPDSFHHNKAAEILKQL